MQPKPKAETLSPPLPTFRVCIAFSIFFFHPIAAAGSSLHWHDLKPMRCNCEIRHLQAQTGARLKSADIQSFGPAGYPLRPTGGTFGCGHPADLISKASRSRPTSRLVEM